MKEENDKNNDSSSDTGAQAPLCGERLAEARRALQIPLVEIAKELHLDEYKVRALECNDFDVLGAPVFAKGHLRKFAQLVDVDEKDVIADYYQLNRSSAPPPLVPTPARPAQVFSLAPWVVGIVVILVAATGYWWFAAGESQPDVPVTGEITALGVTADEPEEGLGDFADDTIALEPQVVLEQDTASVLTDSSTLRLRITYSGDCWTEITDANGQRLFFDMGTAGRSVNLSGEAPFNVLFGNAGNVSLTVNGDAFRIPAENLRGQTARLTITGP